MDLFRRIVRAGSFAAAARDLGASPAFVSKRVMVLEKALGGRLFHRTTRSLTLTEDGEAVFQWVQKILDDVDQMGQVIDKTRAQPRGILRIATSTGFGRNRLAPALSEMMRSYPELGIQLELLDRPVDIVGEGFDVDIRIGGVHEPYLLVKALARNWRILCAAPSYLAKAGTPMTLRELGHHTCILIRERDQSGPWRLSGPHGLESVRPPSILSANNGEVVHQWGLDGHGIFLRSIWDVADHIREGRLVHVLPQYRQDADVHAIYAQRLDRSGRLRVCMQFLQQWFADHPLN